MVLLNSVVCIILDRFGRQHVAMFLPLFFLDSHNINVEVLNMSNKKYAS